MMPKRKREERDNEANNDLPQSKIAKENESDDVSEVKVVHKEVKAFIQANLTICLSTGSTPLHLAIEQGNSEMARLLIEAGADIEARNKSNMTPFHIAIQLQNIAIMELLLKQNESPTFNGTLVHTALKRALKENNLEMISILVKIGALEAIGKTQCFPIIYKAIKSGNLAIVRLLVEGGINITDHDRLGSTPLHYAVRCGHLDIVDFLVEAGAFIETFDRDERTPLHIAALHGHKEIVRFLIEVGADIDAADEDDKTPIILASDKGHLEIARLMESILSLVKNHALETLGEFNDLPLLYPAIKNGNLAIVRLLLQGGINITENDRLGSTPPHIAALHDRLEIVKLLVDTGALIETFDRDQRTPLHIAAQNGYLNVVLFLLNRNANINATDNDDNTAIVLAFENGHHRVVELLQQHGAVLPAHLQAQAGGNINDNQSVHTISVHKGVSEAATALKAKYLGVDAAKRIEEAHEALLAFVNALTCDETKGLTDKNGAAKRCLEWLLSLDFTDTRSNVTLQEAIALVWIGLHEIYERNDLSEGELQVVVAQWLYEINRGYNLSLTGEDNGQADSHTCPSGSFNKSIYTLNSRHALVNIPFVTQETITNKAISLMKAIFNSLEKKVKLHYVTEVLFNQKPLPDDLIDYLQKGLAQLLHEEFDDFDAPGLDVHTIIGDILATVQDVNVESWMSKDCLEKEEAEVDQAVIEEPQPAILTAFNNQPVVVNNEPVVPNNALVNDTLEQRRQRMLEAAERRQAEQRPNP